MRLSRRSLLTAAAATALPGAGSAQTTAPPIARSGPRATLFVDRFQLRPETSAAFTSFATLRAAVRDRRAIDPETLANVALFFRNGGRLASLVDIDANHTAIDSLDRIAANRDLQFDFISVPLAARGAEGERGDAAAIYACAVAAAEAHGALLLIDTPRFLASNWSAADYVSRWRTPLAIDSAFAAFYAPRLNANGQDVCASGAIAGVATQTAPWRSPAGALTGVSPGANINAQESAALTRAAVNAVRVFPERGPTIWGARTASSDPEWRYIPIRRLASLIARDVATLAPWAAGQPNAETTWSALRASVENYLIALWRDGALVGSTSSQAFFVRIDRTTMTQADISARQIKGVIGFAPARPAEFVLQPIAFASA